jgi:hypothetical protein
MKHQNKAVGESIRWKEDFRAKFESTNTQFNFLTNRLNCVNKNLPLPICYIDKSINMCTDGNCTICGTGAKYVCNKLKYCVYHIHEKKNLIN